MAAFNPYQSPRTAVADAGEEYQPVKIFSVSGRVGRVRYIGYTTGLSLLIYAVLAALAGAMGATRAGAVTAGLMMTVAGALTLVISAILTIQRCHDFNASGWLAILFSSLS